jgi:hypothetical protein
MIPRMIVARQLTRSGLLRASSSYPSKASLTAARGLVNAKQSSWREATAAAAVQQHRGYSGSATAAQSEKVWLSTEFA